jgi:uncharacterized damage-inducible protein DinB
MRTSILAAFLALAAAAPLAAQIPDKAVLNGDFERQKGILLKYVDAMPDSGMAFAPTKGVRSYAQQLEHIAQATAGIMAQVAKAGAPPAGDPKVYLADKAALKDFIARSFDFAIAAVQNMSPAQMSGEAELFGMKRTGWKWVVGVQEHTAWTLGQTVPYLRMNGVTPPSYLPF